MNPNLPLPAAGESNLWTKIIDRRPPSRRYLYSMSANIEISLDSPC